MVTKAEKRNLSRNRVRLKVYAINDFANLAKKHAEYIVKYFNLVLPYKVNYYDFEIYVFLSKVSSLKYNDVAF